MCKAGCRGLFRSSFASVSAVRASLGEFHWWMEYGRTFAVRVPTLVRTISPVFLVSGPR